MKDAELEYVKERLAVDYANLFLAVGKHPAHPYESVYLSAEHLLMQEQRDQVLKIYREHGVDKVEDFPEPEDHVAIELQFMGLLSARITEALKQDDIERARELLETQTDFLDEHLMKWVPDFCEDILKGAKYEFYRGIAKVTRGYLTMESENIRTLASELAQDTD
jgi:anaerobic sulfite reductase subunit A